MLNGECVGNVIAGIAKGRDDPIIAWRQIDGSCELRLSAMAAMIDDKVLRHAFGDLKAVVFLDQGQCQIDAGCYARRSPHIAVPTEDTIGLNSDGGVFSLK